MSKTYEISEAGLRVSALSQTEQTDGWKIICERYDQEIAELTVRILDATTPDEEANRLRRIRAKLLELSPTATVATLKAKYSNQAKSAATK